MQMFVYSYEQCIRQNLYFFQNFLFEHFFMNERKKENKKRKKGEEEERKKRRNK